MHRNSTLNPNVGRQAFSIYNIGYPSLFAFLQDQHAVDNAIIVPLTLSLSNQIPRKHLRNYEINSQSNFSSLQLQDQEVPMLIDQPRSKAVRYASMKEILINRTVFVARLKWFGGEEYELQRHFKALSSADSIFMSDLTALSFHPKLVSL